MARRALGSGAGARRLAPLAPRQPAGRRPRGRSSGSAAACPAGPTPSSPRSSPRPAPSAPAIGVGTGLAAPTLLAHGADELKRRLLPRAITGEDTWCQLFSEPGSGSDLAGLTTRATRDGDEWVVDGQKLWSTSAHHADLGLLLARTDWDVPKHRGITLLRPADAPARRRGPSAAPDERPRLVQRGVPHRRPRAGRPTSIGEPGEGWRVAMTTLAHERGFATLRRRRFDVDGRPGRRARPPPRPTSTSPPTPGTRSAPGVPTSSSSRRRSHGRRDDAVVRQRIAGLVALQRAHDWTARRAQAARAAGRAPGSEGSLGKLAASEVARRAAACPRVARRRRRPAHRSRQPARRRRRRGARQRPGAVDRRRHRRDPAQHHRREGARPAARAERRSGRAVPEHPPLSWSRSTTRWCAGRRRCWRRTSTRSSATGCSAIHPGEHIGMPSRHLTFVISFDDPLELSVLPDGAPPVRPLRRPARRSAHDARVVIRHDGNQHGIQLARHAGRRTGAVRSARPARWRRDVVPLDVLWGRLAGELLDRLDAAPARGRERFAVLERRAAAGAVGARRDPVRRPAGDGRGVAPAGR